jgi:hypothetical protein
MYFIAMFCTPIFINTFVVFIRLYWFEKRFQHIAKEARNLRRERTRSRSKSQAKEEQTVDKEEKGVGNRPITVLRGANGIAEGRSLPPAETLGAGMPSHANGDASKDPTTEPLSPSSQSEPAPFHRDIVFADEIKPSRSRGITNDERVPEQRSAEQHIAFVENQRNPKDKGTLRIPGPRDYDQGKMPERVEEGDENLIKSPSGEDPHDDALSRVSDFHPPPSAVGRDTELNFDDHPIKNRKIEDEDEDEPTRNKFRAGIAAFVSPFKSAKPNKGPHPTGIVSLRHRARSRTIGSFTTSRSQEKDPMPYLSWTPTVGRNSAFVDLTEEQREELGGIEYRALKTLAFILVRK